MAQRWKRIGVLTGAIFAINLIGRLVLAFVLDDNSPKQDWVPIAGLSAIAIVFAVLTFVWGRERPMGEIAGDLLITGVLSCVLIVLVGPLLFGKSPSRPVLATSSPRSGSTPASRSARPSSVGWSSSGSVPICAASS